MNSDTSEISSEDLYQISVLIDQLKHEDINLRLNSMQNISRIAKALGADRTRNELIPFLSDESVDDEDELLICLASRIVDLIDCVGGIDYLHILLQPLEVLASSEETSVREMAISSFEKIAAKMPITQLLQHAVPFINKLSTKDWHTSRTSAAALLPRLYNRIPDVNRLDYRLCFTSLLSDDSPLVRRVATSNLSIIIPLLNTSEIINEVLPLVKKLSSDEQDSVRLSLIVVCISLAENLPNDMKTTNILPICLQLASDKCWRVRWTFASKFEIICQTLGKDITSKNLVDVFETLLNDSEPEIRCVLCGRLSLACQYFPKPIIISKVIPSIHRVVTDQSEHVRIALSSSINELSGILGPDSTVEYLLPLILLLLRDEASDVRLNIISNMQSISKVIGVELISQSLLPSILQLAEDPKWRVRLTIIEHMYEIAEHLGFNYFNEKLSSLCLNWLTDVVHTIRKEAINNIVKLTQKFGENWTIDVVFPKIERMIVHSSYLHRITAINCMESLLKCLSIQTIDDIILPILLTMSSDHVANVRFAVAKAFNSFTEEQLKSKNILKKLMNILDKLKNDNDVDVKYFASKVFLK